MPKLSYPMTRFTPSGKWYDDIRVIFPDDIRPYPNTSDVIKAYEYFYAEGSHINWNLVMMESPWGLPVMIPCNKIYGG